MDIKVFFISGGKSFGLTNSSEGWFVLIERGRRFSSNIKIDEESFSNRHRKEQGITTDARVGNHIQLQVFLNYNCYGRLICIEAWREESKSAVIIPEADYNLRWSDISDKILKFLGKNPLNRFKHVNIHQTKSYDDTAKTSEWPELTKLPVHWDPVVENLHLLSSCLVGTFSDPFNFSPN